MDQAQPQTNATPRQLVGIGELLRRSWASYKPRALTYAAIMVIPGVISWVVMFFFVGAVLAALISAGKFSMAANDFGFFSLGDSIPIGIIAFFVFIVLLILVQVWAQATLLFAVTREQEKVAVGEAFRGGLGLLNRVFTVGLLTGLIVFVGLFLFIIPGVIWAVWYSLALVVCVVEGSRGMAALNASRAYVRGFWTAVFLRFLVIGILWSVANSILSQVFGDSGSQLLQALFGLVATPFVTIYTYHLYRDLKAIRDGVPA